jgi:3-phenylpropionate/cinnamic acid dioxygenase small subunit
METSTLAHTLSVEDQLNVRQLLARYPRLMDTRDLEGYVDAFAQDAIIEMETGIVDGVSQFRQVRGHNEIRTMMEGLFSRGPGTPSRLRHVVGEPVIEPSAEGCSAYSYCVIYRVSSDSSSVASVGEYTDDCVKLDGRWVFARRRMVFRPFLG